MNITKYEHAFLDISNNNDRLLIDPGVFTKQLTDFTNVTAVVITHVHADHFSAEVLGTIIASNPDVTIFGTQEVADAFKEHPVEVPKLGIARQIASFTLEFFGQYHEMIDPQTPVVQNIGVLVNERLYYPGDSFTLCPKPFSVLATPNSAPWLRIGETVPLIEGSNCKTIFPTHNGLLSAAGEQATNNWLQKFAERYNKIFKNLEIGESLEVS